MGQLLTVCRKVAAGHHGAVAGGFEHRFELSSGTLPGTSRKTGPPALSDQQAKAPIVLPACGDSNPGAAASSARASTISRVIRLRGLAAGVQPALSDRRPTDPHFPVNHVGGTARAIDAAPPAALELTRRLLLVAAHNKNARNQPIGPSTTPSFSIGG